MIKLSLALSDINLEFLVGHDVYEGVEGGVEVAYPEKDCHQCVRGGGAGGADCRHKIPGQNIFNRDSTTKHCRNRRSTIETLSTYCKCTMIYKLFISFLAFLSKKRRKVSSFPQDI